MLKDLNTDDRIAFYRYSHQSAIRSLPVAAFIDSVYKSCTVNEAADYGRLSTT